ncbi:DUF1963 domain-containing protein [Verrucomicrobium sp. BvORR106]|uniref:DUF1963 domain-containing protein n=1 Tax=Verrucomicrobium sp. BvORR106 TaxID=1403819 RepID=UPI0009DE0550|nr:DUF1963 domain-containing protein [Verrucomicrobium sp. BvORR106]
MTSVEIQASANQLGWPGEHFSFLAESCRPSVDIHPTSAKPRPAESRFGGTPYVAPGFTWPTHANGRYRFLGQVNFEQLRPASRLLPSSGLLSLFYADDDNGEISWQDADYVVGYYWQDLSHHSLVPAPGMIPVNPETAFELVPSLNVPRHRELRNDWPFEEAADMAWDLSLEVNAEHYLLGYPSYCTLAYDPTPGPEWIHLLNLSSSSELNWCWHDGDRLMIFIQANRLKSLDFSILKCDAG